MVAVIQGSRPAPGVGPLRGNSSRGHVVTMVEFRGWLPAQPAGFLGRLSASERRDVYALLGTFKEVRGLVGAGRLLHAYLKEGPRAAARGRITFREFTQVKSEILQSIYELRQKINRVAEDLCLILPRVPRLTL
ncbi:MAG TPA: hypothetical protein VMU54_14585 [Planctomycetota bacterium]|nr:hypothetical protein [Planctomycetota bacterium]